MKKVSLLAVLALLAMSALAYAQVAQDNVYAVSGKVAPSKSGTPKKPTPVGLSFGFTVNEANGRRPASIQKYAIKFDGLVANTNKFPTCTFTQINSAGNPNACKSGSLVGEGVIKAKAGNQANPDDQSVNCSQRLRVYNGGKNKLVLFINGSPTETNPDYQCDVEIAKPIDASLVRSGSGKNLATSLNFTLPPELINNLGLAIAVKDVRSTIKKLTKKTSVRTYGFFESVGGCKQSKRAITVTFTDTQGLSEKSQRTVACS